jgi:hypothetical protein
LDETLEFIEQSALVSKVGVQSEVDKKPRSVITEENSNIACCDALENAMTREWGKGPQTHVVPEGWAEKASMAVLARCLPVSFVACSCFELTVHPQWIASNSPNGQ